MKKNCLILLLLLLGLVSYGQVPAAITGPSQVCVGSSATYTDATPGGTWSSALPLAAPIDSASGTLTGVTASAIAITYTTSGGSAILFVSVNPLPTPHNVTGGGFYCAGGAGIRFGLGGSDIGTSYQMFLAGSTVGSPVAGTGSVLDFGWQSSAGAYSVLATNTITGCQQEMMDSPVVTINALPTAFSVTGGGTYCAGGVGVHIGLSGSNAGVSYQLIIGSSPLGSPVSGTGGPVDFGLLTAAGTYTIAATNATTACSRLMTGSATVSVGVSSGVISGPGSLCLGALITLTDTTGGGTWSSSDPAVATVNGSGMVFGVSWGAALISYSLGGFCTPTHTVYVSPTPAPIAGSTSVCLGASDTLFDGTAGGTWSSSDPVVATISPVAGIFFGVTLGTATITYTTPVGCSTSEVISVVPAVCSGTPVGGSAVSGTGTVCPGQGVLLALSGTSGVCAMEFQWQSSTDGTSFSDITGLTATSGYFFPTSTQYYRCKVTCSTSGLFSYSSSVLVSVHGVITSHMVVGTPDTACAGAEFYISACGTSSGYTVTTYYGDGKMDNLPLSASAPCQAYLIHNYAASGTYLVKQILLLAGIPQDSVSFSYEYTFCRTLPVKFFYDANNNCVHDPGESFIILPVTAEVDSNGIPIDTISTTSGFYYKVFGGAGTVYSFRILSKPAGLNITCPLSGIVYDTIQPGVADYDAKNFAFNCISGSSFDLAEHVTTSTGRHMQTGLITVYNSYCPPEDAVITLTFSPKYVYSSAYPTPSSVVGNVATWNLASISSSSPSYSVINFTLSVPTPGVYATWLTTTDTVNSDYVTAPTTTGDVDTTNNTTKRCDSVRASYDPNEMSVMPEGYILPCTRLQYTVRFENTGNDTAHNIAVLDTLSDDLDPHSLNIEVASSVMNIAIINEAGHNVVKFDFPNINLPDSSHHNQCDGIVIFNIKTRPGLTVGTPIANYAGIFFDDNPAVMTDTAVNTIGLNPITGPDHVCAGATITLTASAGFPGGAWASSSSAVATVGTTGIVTGVSASVATITYSISGACGTTYTTQSVTIKPLPVVYGVSGGGAYCAGDTGVHIGLLNSETATNYLLYHGAASTGPFAGTGAALDFGLQTVAGTYTAVATGSATTCSSDMSGSALVTINPAVTPAVSLIVTDTVCAGASTTFTPVPVNGGSSPTYVWNVDGVNVGVANTYIYVPSNGDVVTLTLTSNAPCAIPATASSAVTMVVEDPLMLSVIVSASSGTAIASGEAVTLSAGLSGSGPITSYQWLMNGTPIPGATDATYTSSTLANNDSVTCIVTTANICGNITAASGVRVTVTNVSVLTTGAAADKVVLLPNPNNGTFTISGFTGSGSDEDASLVVCEITGRIVYSNTVTITNGNINQQLILNNALPKGMYMLSLRSGSGSREFRFVIE